MLMMELEEEKMALLIRCRCDGWKMMEEREKDGGDDQLMGDNTAGKKYNTYRGQCHCIEQEEPATTQRSGVRAESSIPNTSSRTEIGLVEEGLLDNR